MAEARSSAHPRRLCWRRTASGAPAAGMRRSERHGVAVDLARRDVDDSFDPARSAAWAMSSAPPRLVEKKSLGFRNEYGIAICAPRWKTTSIPAIACWTDSASRRPPNLTSTCGRVRRREPVQRPSIATRVVPTKCAHVGAPLRERHRDRAADEPAAAGDQRVSTCPRNPTCLPYRDGRRPTGSCRRATSRFDHC